MNIRIQDLATATPAHAYEQVPFVRDFMKAHVPGDRMTQAILHKIYGASGIATRHSCLPDFQDGSAGGPFFDRETGQVLRPGTGARNDLYTTHARELYVRVARELVERNGGPGAVTHLVTVSCTGFYAPGPDYDIVNACGLRPDVRRYHIGFMGCYALFPALNLAKTICEAEPGANVLVVSVELCTLHLNFTNDTDAMLSASVFADGAAGAWVSAAEPTRAGTYRMGAFRTLLTGAGAADMAWSIGDHGFDMVLTTYVPDILHQHMPTLIPPRLLESGLGMEDVRHWAVHPGGRAILDKVSQGLGLAEDALDTPRRVLSRFGNMSSATIGFVLDEVRRGGEPGPVCAMAFGPGLTVETAVLQLDA